MNEEITVECEICGQTYSGDRAIRSYTTETWLGKGKTEECIRHCKGCHIQDSSSKEK